MRPRKNANVNTNSFIFYHTHHTAIFLFKSALKGKGEGVTESPFSLVEVYEGISESPQDCKEVTSTTPLSTLKGSIAKSNNIASFIDGRGKDNSKERERVCVSGEM